MPQHSDEKEFGTAEERAKVIAEIKAWAESFGEDDYKPIIFLYGPDKTFTPRELAQDMAEDTALGTVLLDMIIFDSRKTMATPLAYTKRLFKRATTLFPQ